jgi:hypothetical protein
MPKKTKRSKQEIDDEITTNIVEMIQNIHIQLEVIHTDIYNLDVKIDNNWHMIKGSTSWMREPKKGGSL